MKKFLVYVLIVILTLILAELYGMAHNQISYPVSPEYFTKYTAWCIPEDVTHLRRFLCARYLHNASSLGGTLAIFVASAFQLIVRVRQI